MKIRLSEKIGYGLGDMSSSMFWKLFGAYLMIFILMYLVSRQQSLEPCSPLRVYGTLF